tara:strand:- start:1745 stop:2149 length:405 start_codon:yes stop_codon:yes gene_type:complete
MQYKVVIIILLLAFIYSGAIREYFSSPENIFIKEMQQEILVNKKELDVFDKKNINDVTVTENRIKAYNIIISYDDVNHNIIKNKLTNSGYKAKHNLKKSFYSLGPFSDLSHAKEESKKLNNLYGLENKIIELLL